MLPILLASAWAQVSVTGATVSGATVSTSPNVLQITTSALPNGQVATAYSATISTTGGLGSLTFTVISGAIPTGLTLNPSTGAITGTPTLASNFPFTIQVTDSTSPTPQQAQQALQIAVICPPLTIITSATLPNGVNGQPYSVTMQASGGILPLSWSLVSGTFPLGLSISPTGTISGTPTESGTFNNLVIQVTDSCAAAGQSIPGTFSLTINDQFQPLSIVTTSPLPGGVKDQPYNFQMVGAGGSETGYVWSISAGALPTGLSMSPGGLISGTPSVLQTATVSIHLVDDAAHTADLANATLTISEQSNADNLYCQTNEVTTFNGQSDGPALLPQKCVRTAMSDTPATGPTIIVTTGSASDLQSKLTNAVCGQTIVIPAQTSPLPTQAVYVAAVGGISNSFVLPALNCPANNWLIIRTDKIANLPEGTRVTPCAINTASVPNRPAYSCTNKSFYMPQLVGGQTAKTTESDNHPLVISPGASHIRVIGLELTGNTWCRNCSALIANGTDHVIADRIIVHPGQNSAGNSSATCTEQGQVAGTNWTCNNRIGVLLDWGASYDALIDSYVYDIHSDGRPNSDAQAVQTGNGQTPGPIKIVNNFLESTGENIFLGGSDPSVSDLIPADIEIRRNYAFKPLSWKKNDPNYAGYNHKIKNCLELKTGQRVLIEGNVLDGAWFGQADQDGGCVLFTPKNPNLTTPVVQDRDITVRYNRITRANKGIEIAAGSASRCTAGHLCLPLPALNFSIHDNVLDYINAPTAGSSNPNGGCCDWAKGFKLGSELPQFSNVSIVHNTVITTIDSNQLNAQIQGADAFINANGQFVEKGTWTVGTCYDVSNIVHVSGTTYYSIYGTSDAQGATSCTVRNGGHVATAADQPGVGANWQTYWVVSPITYGSWDKFVFKDNIGTGGIKGSSPVGAGIGACINQSGAAINTLGTVTSVGGFTASTGCLTATTNANGWIFQGNALITNPYPGSNFRANTPYPQTSPNPSAPSTPNITVADWAAMKFVNFNNGNGGDYHLQASSPGHLAASDGKDIGADIDELNRRIAGIADPEPPVITITVAPTSATVPIASYTQTAGGTQQFQATVTGSSNTAVRWKVCNADTCFDAGISSQYGVVSSSGLYTAPQFLPNPASFRVIATAQADTSKNAVATVTADRNIHVSTTTCTPAFYAALLAGNKGTNQQCNMTLTSDNTSRVILWRVASSYVGGGNGADVIHHHGSGYTSLSATRCTTAVEGNWTNEADLGGFVVACVAGASNGTSYAANAYFFPGGSTPLLDDAGLEWQLHKDAETYLGVSPLKHYATGFSSGSNYQSMNIVANGSILAAVAVIEGHWTGFDNLDTLCGSACASNVVPNANYPVNLLYMRGDSGATTPDAISTCGSNSHSSAIDEDLNYYRTRFNGGTLSPNANPHCTGGDAATHRGGTQSSETWKKMTFGTGQIWASYELRGTGCNHSWHVTQDIRSGSNCTNAKLLADYPSVTGGHQNDIVWSFFNSHSRSLHTVSVTWTASTTAGVTYNVYRSTTTGGPYSLLTSTDGLYIIDSAVSAGTTYYYVIRAYDGTNESINSNEASAAIP